MINMNREKEREMWEKEDADIYYTTIENKLTSKLYDVVQETARSNRNVYDEVCDEVSTMIAANNRKKKIRWRMLSLISCTSLLVSIGTLLLVVLK